MIPTKKFKSNNNLSPLINRYMGKEPKKFAVLHHSLCGRCFLEYCSTFTIPVVIKLFSINATHNATSSENLKLGGVVCLSSAKLFRILVSHLNYKNFKKVFISLLKWKNENKNYSSRRCWNGKGTTIEIPVPIQVTNKAINSSKFIN
jgi:hypothetical protein